jgi:hypothetical protein
VVSQQAMPGNASDEIYTPVLFISDIRKPVLLGFCPCTDIRAQPAVQDPYVRDETSAYGAYFEYEHDPALTRSIVNSNEKMNTIVIYQAKTTGQSTKTRKGKSIARKLVALGGRRVAFVSDGGATVTRWKKEGH